MKLTAIDLFSGGGGLTVGLKRTDFQVKAAVELDAHAMAVYQANHPEVEPVTQDIRKVDFRSKSVDWGNIDLVSGCPPCQGFSSLTRKYRQVDPRNELVLEFARAVEELRPTTVMMENVPGMATRGKVHFDALVARLAALGYVINWKVLQVADYGVPQMRRRLVLLAGLGFEIPIPEATHSNDPKSGLLPWRTVRQTLKGMPKAKTLKESIQSGGPRAQGWHIVRDMSLVNRARLATIKAGENRTILPEELKVKCHKGGYGGFANVYTRMSWDAPSPTMTGGCTTLSKGRFGHPEEMRTISVREAALLQTFPPNYDIATNYMEKACTVIGNALPCDFAVVLATACRSAINNYCEMKG